MNIFILNRNEEIVQVLSDSAEKSACHFFNSKLVVELNKGSNFTFEVDALNEELLEHIKEENFVVVSYDGSEYKLFIIREIVDIHSDSLIKEVYCEDASIELADEIILESFTDKVEIVDALKSMLKDTRWTSGIVDDTYIRQLTEEYKSRSVLDAIYTLASEYNVEVDFSVEFTGNTITGRKVNIKKAFGRTLGKRFESSKDIISLKRTIQTGDIKTAIIPYGKTNEETGEVLTIKNVVWEASQNPMDKPVGQIFLEDKEATEVWGYTGVNGKKRPRWFAVHFDEVEDENELIKLAHLQLKRMTTPKVSYEVEALDLFRLLGHEEASHEEVRLGDLVNIIDHEFTPALTLTSRVVKIEHDLNNPANTKFTLGNIVESIVDKDLKTQLQELNYKVGAIQNKVDLSDIENRLDNIETNISSGRFEDINELNNLLFGQSLGYHYIEGENGLWIYDRPKDQRPTKVVAIKGGMIGLGQWDSQLQKWKIGTFIDGTNVNASMITTGTLSADRIEAGTLDINKLNVALRSKIAEIDGKASTGYVDTKISTAVDSINLSVSSKYATKSETESLKTSAVTESKKYSDTKKAEAISEAVQSSKSYADTKKAEAITQAGKDADSKVATAKTELNGKIDSKANKTDVYTKTQTYTKAETDSAIKVAKDSVELGVSNKYETKTNVTNKINSAKTEAINSAVSTSKSYADTKKTEAITQAGKDADSKVNSAKTELNNKIDLKASKTDVYVKSEVYTKSQTDSAIKIAKDEINLSVSNNYETKTNVENKLSNITTTLTNKIDGIQFGGTNIATDTNKGVTGWGWGLQTGGKTITEVTENGIRCCKLARDSVASTGWSYISYNRIGRNKYLPNRKYTVSFEVKASVVTSFYVGLKEGNSSNPLTGDAKTGNTVANTWTKLSATITTLSTLPSSASQILYLNGMSSGTGVTYIFRNLVITEGTKAPSWSPAPEDVDSSINSKASKTDVYTKSETYSKAQTDSAIKVAKDQINLSVSGTYETKTNVSSQVNTALSSAKSYTDTKKNEAILTASTDATNKVNSAKTELNTAINKKANSIDVYTKTQTYTKAQTDSAIKVAKDSIELGVKNTYETKSSVESKLSNVTNTLTGKIDAIQVGGRNLAQGASNIYTTAYSSFSGGTNTCPSLAKVLTDGLAVGDTVTVKLIYKYTNIVATSGQTAKCWIQGYGNSTAWNSGSFNSSTQKVLSGSGEHTFLYSFKITPEHLKNSSWSTSIRHDYVQSGSVQWKMFKVEKGNKATDFTFSPEDIDLAINKKANIVDVYKKSETYTKSETDSKINVAKDSINLGVSQTYETKNNVSSQVSSALISAKNYADTKKTEAINSANSSTDTKLKSYSTTTQMNSAIQVAKDSITNTVSSTYAKKADVESTYATKSSLTQTANNITAKFEASGGYNLLKNSKAKNGTKFWLNNGGGISVNTDSTYEKCFKTQAPAGIRYHESIKLKNNTEYVYEGYIYSRTAIDGSRSAPLHFWCMSTANTSGQSQLTVLDYRQTIPTVNKWTKCYVHFRTASSGDVYFTPFVYVGGSTTFDFWVTELSLSESAVESKWTSHPNEVYSGSTVIDASGVTINNGALTVKNNSGVTVLSGDSNGNLDITGTVKSQKGNMYVSLDYGGVTFQSAHNNEQLLRMETTAFTSDKNVNGVDFNLAKYGEYLSFNHINKENLNNGWSSSDGRYNFMDFWSKDTTLGSKTYKKGININSPMYINKWLQLYSGSNVYADIDGSISWNNGTGTVSNLLGMYGDNGAILGYKSGSNLQARFLVTEASHPGTGDNLISWGNYNFNGYTFHNANIVAKSLSVQGSKNCLQETKSYGARLINAYETAEYYFGDLGFGKINEEGVCYVDIDDVFLECVNTDAQYHVFTQIYNGKITSIERYKTYFIVKGEPNTKFSWELKAKRKGYENSRLDTQPIDIDAIDSGLELFTDSDFNAITSEKILINVLDFNLENILLMEE